MGAPFTISGLIEYYFRKVTFHFKGPIFEMKVTIVVVNVMQSSTRYLFWLRCYHCDLCLKTILQTFYTIYVKTIDGYVSR